MIGVDATGRIPTVLGIDVEPDGSRPRPSTSWAGFESMIEFIDGFRDRATAVTGEPAQFTWFLRMDPQIAALQGSPTWIAERYSAELDRLRRAGDAVGVHTHAWRRAGGDETSASWVADWADEGWADHALAVALTSFAEAFGRRCELHRFGDRFISSRLHRQLGAHGVGVDLTVEPGARAVHALYRGWRGTRRTLDYARAPRGPYLPLPTDPLRGSPSGESGSPWLLPLTAVDATPMLPLWRRIARELRYPGRVRHRPIVLWADGPAIPLWSAVERELAVSVGPYLAFAIRSDALLAPASAVPLRAKLDGLLRSPLGSRLRFADPLSAMAALLPEFDGETPQPAARSDASAAPVGVAAASASPATAQRGV